MDTLVKYGWSCINRTKIYSRTSHLFCHTIKAVPTANRNKPCLSTRVIHSPIMMNHNCSSWNKSLAYHRSIRTHSALLWTSEGKTIRVKGVLRAYCLWQPLKTCMLSRWSNYKNWASRSRSSICLMSEIYWVVFKSIENRTWLPRVSQSSTLPSRAKCMWTS